MSRVTVIMGIYNCASTLPEALDSLLNQTYTDWQAVLCDDGSKDETYTVALEYAKRYPDKIILIRNESNMGLNFTLNHCLSVADTPYIARMDGDDLSIPERLEREVEFLDQHPQYAIVSANMSYFDESGEWGQSSMPIEPQPEQFLHGTPFCHAPCMVKKEAFDAVQGYSVAEKYLRVEDYHLWLKMYAKGYRGYNLSQVLYRMRDDRSAFRRRKFRYRINEARVMASAVSKLNLPVYGYLYCLRPILVGLLPTAVYTYLHKLRVRKREC